LEEELMNGASGTPKRIYFNQAKQNLNNTDW
jgi:hypothetical protein